MKPINHIALIGSGSAAGFFGKMFIACGKSIRFIYSRNPETACVLAEELGSFYMEEPDFTEIDLVLICVKDDEISNVSQKIPTGFKGIVCHCAGSVDVKVLAGYRKHGVVYPLQSLKGETDAREVPFLLEGSTHAVQDELVAFAKELGIKFRIADSKTRFEYHLAAVFVNNFSNAMLSAAEKLLIQHGLSMNLLYPLIRKTFENITGGQSPSLVQTGPAKRGDEKVMNKHLSMLEEEPALQALYKAVSEYIRLNS